MTFKLVESVLKEKSERRIGCSSECCHKLISSDALKLIVGLLLSLPI